MTVEPDDDGGEGLCVEEEWIACYGQWEYEEYVDSDGGDEEPPDRYEILSLDTALKGQNILAVSVMRGTAPEQTRIIDRGTSKEEFIKVKKLGSIITFSAINFQHPAGTKMKFVGPPPIEEEEHVERPAVQARDADLGLPVLPSSYDPRSNRDRKCQVPIEGCPRTVRKFEHGAQH